MTQWRDDGGFHEEAKKDEWVESDSEKEEYQKVIEKNKGDKKVSHLTFN
jgi:hypothetical protein